jgi:hypothetical protein
MAQGGVFFGTGTDCNQQEVPCGVGTSTSVISIDELIDVLLDQTTDQGLTEQADFNNDQIVDGRDLQPFIDFTLAETSIPDGACCIGAGDTALCAVVRMGICETLAGSFRGAGTVCDESCDSSPGEIAFGCCMPEGTCSELTPAACATAGGLSDPDALLCEERARRAVHPRADLNRDGLLDGRDVQAFVNQWVGP